MVSAQLPLRPALPRHVRLHRVHEYGLQDSSAQSGHALLLVSHVARFVTRRQVKLVCDSLGMRFSEELNSHNCTFVVCATPSGAEGDAALAVTGDKMTQVRALQLAGALLFDPWVRR